MSTNFKGIYVLRYIGVMLMFVAGVILLPLVLLPFCPGEAKYALCFVIPAAACFITGFAFGKVHVPEDCRLSIGSDAVIVAGTWILAVFFSALPFIFARMLNFTQAYFEAMSGWTTTGLSVVDVTKAPMLFLFFRSVMQFFGGFGIVLVVVSALSESLGMRLYTAEGHNDKLLPNLAKSARMILKIYVGYFIAGTVLYIVFGMPVFDAVNHCMAALSTGGFSTKADSIGAYDSLPLELVTVILMLLGETNFFAHMLLVRRKFRSFFRLGETRLTLVAIAVAAPVVAVVSLLPLYGRLTAALRVGFFNIVSAITTTGFSTASFNNWPAFAWLAIIALMIIGGGAGSTAGGIKAGRVYLLMKQIIWSVRRKFLPEKMVNQPVIYRPEGKTILTQELYAESASYTLIYFIILFAGTLILAGCGYSLQDSLFEFTSALGTVGLSIGLTGIRTVPVALWTMTCGMFLGRLEIFVIFYAVIKVAQSIKRRL